MLKKFSALPRAIFRFLRYPYWTEIRKGIAKGFYPAFITYRFVPKPRHGWGNPAHERLHQIISSAGDRYAEHLSLLSSSHRLVGIGRHPTSNGDPAWDNPWFTGIDAAMLHYFIGKERPETYIEIGSGNSTKFARHAQQAFGTDTRIISIDPRPRAEIDLLADEVYRQGLEEIDLSLFATLRPGDILFLDSSHRCFMGSDVTVFFLEVLPKVAPGVLIQIHDIHLPFDYPPHRILHYESEQYRLAAQLMIAPERFSIEMASRVVLSEARYAKLLEPLRPFSGDAGNGGLDYTRGSSFWFRLT